jgi:DNA-binding GntR family transcriptional regulator
VTAEALDEHDEIIRGIATRNPKAAADAMRRHIEKVWSRFGSLFDQD